MKIYTRSGDDGTTGLFGGGRVPKSDQRIACCGELDELNAALGVAASLTTGPQHQLIRQVQHELFNIGAQLATLPGSASAAQVPALHETSVQRLEQEIDAAEQQLQPLRQFILPGGCAPAAALHLARTVCRRAERAMVRLAAETPLPPPLLAYINRLSDWLFVQARLANHLAGVSDVPWQKDAAH